MLLMSPPTRPTNLPFPVWHDPCYRCDHLPLASLKLFTDRALGRPFYDTFQTETLLTTHSNPALAVGGSGDIRDSEGGERDPDVARPLFFSRRERPKWRKRLPRPHMVQNPLNYRACTMTARNSAQAPASPASSARTRDRFRSLLHGRGLVHSFQRPSCSGVVRLRD